MDEKEKTILEIRKGAVGQFVLATGQFLGEIDKILFGLGFKDQDIANMSPMVFAYYIVRIAIIKATDDLKDINFSYVDEYKKAIAKTYALNSEAIKETEKDLEVATLLFDKVTNNYFFSDSLNKKHEAVINLSREFVAILFNDPLKNKRVVSGLIQAIGEFSIERSTQLRSLFKYVVSKIETAIQEKESQ